jgi:hypothetical protein
VNPYRVVRVSLTDGFHLVDGPFESISHP